MVRTFMPQPGQEEAQITLARRMFIAGCLGLPWLHVCNCWYFWPKVFGSGGGGQRAHPELAKCTYIRPQP